MEFGYCTDTIRTGYWLYDGLANLGSRFNFLIFIIDFWLFLLINFFVGTQISESGRLIAEEIIKVMTEDLPVKNLRYIYLFKKVPLS